MNKRELEFYNRLDEVHRHMSEQGPADSGEPETFIPHPDFDPDEHDMDEAEEHINSLAEGIKGLHESGKTDAFKKLAEHLYFFKSSGGYTPDDHIDGSLKMVGDAIKWLRKNNPGSKPARRRRLY